MKKISKNLNKEYFIHEKIYSSNNNKNDKESKYLERIKLDKKIQENISKIENKNKINTEIGNKSFINKNKKNNNNQSDK